MKKIIYKKNYIILKRLINEIISKNINKLKIITMKFKNLKKNLKNF